MSSKELIFNGEKCDNCGYLGFETEMNHTIYERGVIITCKDKSQCYTSIEPQLEVIRLDYAVNGIIVK